MVTDIASDHSLHVMNANSEPDGHRPSDQANTLKLWLHLQAANLACYRPQQTLLLSPEADTRFTIPQRVEG